MKTNISTERLPEVAKECGPGWDLNPQPLSYIQML